MKKNAPTRQTILRKLYSPVLSDVLDSLGYRRQAMRPFVRPLDEDLVLFGRARTGAYSPVYHVPSGRKPYALEMELIDSLRANEVAVLACGGPTDRIAPWGELLTTAAKLHKAAGCVTDGLVRDVRRIREMRFPVFHGGIGPLDSKGRGEMIARDVPVECGGVHVEPGDWLFGDIDGLVVIPQAIAERTFAEALAKVDAEDTVRKELLKGKSLAEVFEKHGVL